MEREGRTPIVRSGQLQDEFPGLVTDPANPTLARVSMNVGESENYGAIKVGASVTLTCDQNEATINKAAELACRKALEFMRDGYKLMVGETS